MSLRSQLGKLLRSPLHVLYRRSVPLGDRGPIVSFTFDDFPRSASTVGAPILERFGARGTYYVAAGLANTSGELGDLFVEQDVHSLVDRGHEIASHTFRHSSSRSISLADFRADVREGMKAVERLTGSNTGNFAYPYGHITVGTKRILTDDLRSARSIIPGINQRDGVDLNLLRANHLYGGLEVSQTVQALIRQNVRQKGWLIFYTHDIQPKPSACGCTPELFEFAVSQADASGCKISTVDNVLSQIGIQPAVAQQLVTSASGSA